MTDRVAYTFISQPLSARRRRDMHGLRCNFRRLVNNGLMLNRDFDHFVSIVDRFDSIDLAIQYLNGVHDDILAAMRANV
jgi:hypothetical protein